MKKLLALTLCLSLFLVPLQVFAYNDYEPPETYNYDYEDEYSYDGESSYTGYDEMSNYGYHQRSYYGYDQRQYYDYNPMLGYEGYSYYHNNDHYDTTNIEDLYDYDGYYYHDFEPPEEVESFEPPLPPPIIIPPRYTSSAVVVMDADTGLVLYGSEHNTPHYPASTTKIMTALLVLEHVHDLSERIEFSYNAVFSIPRNSSHIAMDVGETLTVLEALYGLMLSSANEVSIALAEHVAGTVEEFVDLMNRRAMSLGARDTHFENPSGLPGNGHITTAYDLALIMREAVRHYVFVDIIRTLRFNIPPTERQNYSRPLLNTNRLIHPGAYYNEWVVGGKTGWTHAARHTLVTYAEKNGRRLIISTLNSEGGGTFRDTLALMSFGFSMPFEEKLVFESNIYTRRIPVYQNVDGSPLNVGYIAAQAAEDLYFMLPLGFDMRDLRFDLSIPERIIAPVLVGDVVGHVAVYLQNIRAGELDFIAKNLVLGLPTNNSETQAGGSQSSGLPYAPPPVGYYPGLAAYPSPIWENEILLTIALPVAISALVIIISVLIIVISRRRQMCKVLLGNKRMRYYRSYRYK